MDTHGFTEGKAEGWFTLARLTPRGLLPMQTDILGEMLPPIVSFEAAMSCNASSLKAIES
ncbi:MAG TPA: hypothetical protein VH110_06845 [Candidatus Acidoferrum sp.]|nr:hypothetical protein [Candidatus Acidoferrum sp.]